MFPSGGTPVLAAAPLPAQGTNFLRSQRSDCQRAFDEDPYQYSMQQLGQGPIAAATGYTEVVDLGGGGGWWWVVVVGSIGTVQLLACNLPSAYLLPSGRVPVGGRSLLRLKLN